MEDSVNALPPRNQTEREGIGRLSLLVSGSSHSGVFACILFCTSVFLKGTYINFERISNYAPRSIRLFLGFRNPTAGHQRSPSTPSLGSWNFPPNGSLMEDFGGGAYAGTAAGLDRAPAVWGTQWLFWRANQRRGPSQPVAGANGRGGPAGGAAPG